MKTLNMRNGIARAQAAVLILTMMASLVGAFARPARAEITELFFSEYIEGSSYNKAVEIYNGTGGAVDLAAGLYSVAVYFNGATETTTIIDLTGTVADGDVYVVADDSASANVLDETDQTTTYSLFNGDDAVALLKDGTIIDVIGQIGYDPGYYWGSGDVTTQDHTLRRKGTIETGDTDGSDAFDPVTEWDGFPVDTFDGLGAHTVVALDYTTIYDIQYTEDLSGDSPYAGVSGVTTEGIVTGIFYDGYYIEDPAGGAWKGLFVYDSTNSPALGDHVRLTGTVSEYNNLTELGTITEFTVETSGNPVPAPEVLATGDVSQEQWEGVLVRVEDVTVTNEDLGYGEWSVSDGSGDVVVDDKGSYTYVPVNDDAIDAIVGPLDYTFGAFKIQPRDDGDIIILLDYTTIHDIQYTEDLSGDSPYAGESDVTTEGIVTGIFYDGYYIEDPAGGAWKGLFVYDSTNSPALGDHVRLTGTVSEYNNLTELGTITEFTVETSGNPVPAPEVLATGDVSQEQWEGVLVRVEDVTVTNEDLGYGEWSVSDGSGDVVVDDKGSYTYVPVNDDAIDAIVGPLDYTFGAFKIQPRDDGDILLPANAELVINEIMQDPAAVYDSYGEWFELFNPTGDDIDIDGWTIQDNDSDAHVIDNGAPLYVPAGGFLVLGNTITPTLNGGVDVGYSYGSSWFLANGADEIVLLNSSLQEVDRVEYDGGVLFPDPTGASMSLKGTTLDNSLGENWCTSTTPFGDGDLGTPGAANECPSDVVINEIMQDPNAVSDSYGEWFELYNTTDADIDVNGWTIKDNDYDSHVIDNGAPLYVPAGGFLVLGNTITPTLNGGVDVAYSYGSNWFLANGADEVILLDAGLYEVDRVEYDGGTTFPDPTGASMSLKGTALDNNLGENWCTSTTPFGDGDLGTPGEANTCEIPPKPDLELYKSVSDYNPEEGDVITYTLEVLNSEDGTMAATTVVVRDYVPGVANAVTYVGNTCDAEVTEGAVTWNVGSLEVGASQSCDVAVQIRTQTDGTHFDNLAEVLSADQDDLDSTAGNLGDAPAEDDEAFVTVWVGTDSVCGTDATYIHAIQGTGTESSEVGNIHTIEGVVVGDYQDTEAELGGFFLQEEDADADGAEKSSEGIFVYDDGFWVDVHPGDLVRATGTVAEYYSLTELTSILTVTLCSDGNSVTPAEFTLPVSDLVELEYVEGMLVHMAQELYVTENYQLGRYGEMQLSAGDRLYNPTSIVLPGEDAIALQDLNDRSRVLLDDGSNIENPDPIIYPSPELSATNTVRSGDTVSDLVGVMDYDYGVYRIQPVGPITFTPTNERTAAPDPVDSTAFAAELKVASFNVLNYFTTIDTGAWICGPYADMNCRGADSAEELVRQRAKIVNAIVAIDADVVGLIEIENPRIDEPDYAVQDLVSGLNDATGAGTYDYIDTGTIGTDAIKQAFIYQPGSVTPVGAHAILDSSVDPTFLDDWNRPVLAQTFEESATGERLTVAVNHLKSKGTPCTDPDFPDPDTGDGQGNCNLTRLAAANSLADWLATDPTGSGDPDFLIIGDLNSYAMEDPIAALKDAGYSDLVNEYVGEYAYSYIFDGQAGYLDHALGNAGMAAQVTGVTVWHVNADEPNVLSYDMNYISDHQVISLYTSEPYRASDHDPVVVGLYLWREYLYLPFVIGQ